MLPGGRAEHTPPCHRAAATHRGLGTRLPTRVRGFRTSWQWCWAFSSETLLETPSRISCLLPQKAVDQVFKRPSSLSHHQQQKVLQSCNMAIYETAPLNIIRIRSGSTALSLVKYLFKATTKKQSNKTAMQQSSFEQKEDPLFISHKCEFQMI